MPEALRPLAGELAQALRGELEGAVRALHEGDLEAMKARLHAFKGAAMRFGLTEVWQSAARAEQGAGKMLESALRELGALLDELERETRAEAAGEG